MSRAMARKRMAAASRRQSARLSGDPADACDASRHRIVPINGHLNHAVSADIALRAVGGGALAPWGLEWTGKG